MNMRFSIALSYPSEHRVLVGRIADRLDEVLGNDAVFFDRRCQDGLVGPDLHVKLQEIYGKQSKLIVPFFSRHYRKRWCKIEWKYILEVLKERREEGAVVPVHLDGTNIPGWKLNDLGIEKKNMNAMQIAEKILDVYEIKFGPVNPPRAEKALKSHLTRSINAGELHDSLIAPTILKALQSASGLALKDNYNLDWPTNGILLSDEYLAITGRRARQPDWQTSFPQVATPMLVGFARTLKPSSHLQSFIERLCSVIARKMKMPHKWRETEDDLLAKIYRACVAAKHLDDDSVLLLLRRLAKWERR